MVRSKELLKKAKDIRLIAMDVDGVLTSGEVVVLESGEEVKFWNAKDRLCLALIRDRMPDYVIAWITGRQSKAVSSAAEDLGIKFVMQGCKNKKDALLGILHDLNFSKEQAAYIGDDLIDLPAIQISGFSAAPADAVSDVRSRVDYLSSISGGYGVVRDVLEFILKAQGKWEPLIQSFLD